MNRAFKINLLSVCLRSFLLQTLMNYTRMQGLGFGLAMMSLARAMRLKGEALTGFLRRHFGFFNAHPYLATYALGAITRLEIEGKEVEKIEELKNKLLGPLGLLGDQVFWSRFKPLMAILAVLSLLFLGWPPQEAYRKEVSLLLLTLFIIYNAVQCWIRWKGLVWGYRSGSAVLRVITQSGLVKYRLHLGLAAGAISGFFLVQANHQFRNGYIFFGSFAAAMIGIKLKAPLWMTMLFAFAISLVISFLLGIRLNPQG